MHLNLRYIENDCIVKFLTRKIANIELSKQDVETYPVSTNVRSSPSLTYKKPMEKQQQQIGITMSQEAIALPECSSDSPKVVRENVRQQLSSDIEEFLKKGGSVKRIDDNVRADPPKKPTMNYGSAPI